VKLLLVLLAALAGAVGVGQLISSYPGVVAISVDGQIIRLSLALFVVAGTLGALLLSWLLTSVYRLLTLRSRLRRWWDARHRHAALQRLEAGMLALAVGDYARAERQLGRGAGHTPLHYLAAAQAAHAQQARGRRDALLALAGEGTAEVALALGVRRAEMQLDDDDALAAEQTLAPLLARHAEQRQVLLVRHRLLDRLNRHTELQALLPILRRQKVYSPERLAALEAEVAVRCLGEVMGDPAALNRLWLGLNKSTRATPSVVAAYARALLNAATPALAEEVLRKALVSQWDARLVALYGELQGAPAKIALTRAERWLADHRDDPVLLLALGRLCAEQQLWGKARAYFEASLARRPLAIGYRLLADVCESLGEPQLAQRQRILGLECATATPPVIPLLGTLEPAGSARRSGAVV
jgi:HemY protein